MKDLIKEYIKVSIESKKAYKKEIQRIDDVVKQIAEVVADQQVIIDEFKDESYKTKFKEEHKKYKDLEKESKSIIDELTNELKKCESKLKKET